MSYCNRNHDENEDGDQIISNNKTNDDSDDDDEDHDCLFQQTLGVCVWQESVLAILACNFDRGALVITKSLCQDSGKIKRAACA